MNTSREWKKNEQTAGVQTAIVQLRWIFDAALSWPPCMYESARVCMCAQGAA